MDWSHSSCCLDLGPDVYVKGLEGSSVNQLSFSVSSPNINSTPHVYLADGRHFLLHRLGLDVGNMLGFFFDVHDGMASAKHRISTIQPDRRCSKVSVCEGDWEHCRYCLDSNKAQFVCAI